MAVDTPPEALGRPADRHPLRRRLKHPLLQILAVRPSPPPLRRSTTTESLFGGDGNPDASRSKRDVLSNRMPGTSC